MLSFTGHWHGKQHCCFHSLTQRTTSPVFLPCRKPLNRYSDRRCKARWCLVNISGPFMICITGSSEACVSFLRINPVAGFSSPLEQCIVFFALMSGKGCYCQISLTSSIYQVYELALLMALVGVSSEISPWCPRLQSIVEKGLCSIRISSRVIWNALHTIFSTVNKLIVNGEKKQKRNFFEPSSLVPQV